MRVLNFVLLLIAAASVLAAPSPQSGSSRSLGVLRNLFGLDGRESDRANRKRQVPIPLTRQSRKSQFNTRRRRKCPEGTILNIAGECTEPIIERRVFVYTSPADSARQRARRISSEPRQQIDYHLIVVNKDEENDQLAEAQNLNFDARNDFRNVFVNQKDFSNNVNNFEDNFDPRSLTLLTQNLKQNRVPSQFVIGNNFPTIYRSRPKTPAAIDNAPLGHDEHRQLLRLLLNSQKEKEKARARLRQKPLVVTRGGNRNRIPVFGNKQHRYVIVQQPDANIEDIQKFILEVNRKANLRSLRNKQKLSTKVSKGLAVGELDTRNILFDNAKTSLKLSTKLDVNEADAVLSQPADTEAVGKETASGTSISAAKTEESAISTLEGEGSTSTAETEASKEPETISDSTSSGSATDAAAEADTGSAASAAELNNESSKATELSEQKSELESETSQKEESEISKKEEMSELESESKTLETEKESDTKSQSESETSETEAVSEQTSETEAESEKTSETGEALEQTSKSEAASEQTSKSEAEAKQTSETESVAEQTSESESVSSGSKVKKEIAVETPAEKVSSADKSPSNKLKINWTSSKKEEQTASSKKSSTSDSKAVDTESFIKINISSIKDFPLVYVKLNENHKSKKLKN